MGTTTTQQYSSFFTCELKIKEAKNIESSLRGKLFVRYYLPCGLGNKTSIWLETREIPAKSDHIWDETLSLECRGIDAGRLQREQGFIFEIRSRKNVVSFLGGSKLLGRAEISLAEILASPDKVFDKWLNTVSTCGGKSPRLKVEIKLARVFEEVKLGTMKKNWDKCGCRDGQDHDHHRFTCDDYDVFALIAAIEA